MAFPVLTTNATAAEIFYNKIAASANAANLNLKGMIAQILTIYNLIWNNADQANLSPDKAWAALGTNAVAMRTNALAVIAAINSVMPAALPSGEPAGWTVVQNNDGSITATHA